MKTNISIQIKALLQKLKNMAAAILNQMRAHREALSYYTILTVVLAIIGLAAYGYRHGGLIQNVPTVKTEKNAITEQVEPVAAIATTPEPQIPMCMPVGGEVIGEFVSDQLVWSETLEQWQTHAAIDLAAAQGEAVVAVADGTVQDAYTDPLYGNIIVIDHGDGRKALYGSLSTLQLVEIGQTVKRGEVISAAATNTAEAHLGAHVHIEYTVDGIPADFSLETF